MPDEERQHTVCRYADNRQPEFFKGNPPKEIQAFFQRAADFLIGRVGRENIVSAVVHMDEKTPHLHLTFVPLTKDNRLCAKGDYRQPGKPDEVAGRFSRLYGGEIPRLGAWGERQQDRPEAYPHPAFQTGRFPSPGRPEPLKPTLDGINPLNAERKKRSPLLLKKWFPQMENFSGQLKKYKVTINGPAGRK